MGCRSVARGQGRGDPPVSIFKAPPKAAKAPQRHPKSTPKGTPKGTHKGTPKGHVKGVFDVVPFCD